VPVGERRHEDEALAVRESSAGKPADRSVEEVLVLIELYDVIAGPASATTPSQFVASSH
jgi:hypothetical protein